MDVLNNTTNAKFIPTIIAQKALGRLSSYLSLAKNISRDSDWTTATEGQTIRVPKRGAVVANDKSQGSAFTKQNPTATDVYVTLDTHKEVTIAIDDVTKVLENQDSLAGYAEDGAIALAEAVETEVANLHPSVAHTVTFDNTSEDTIDSSLLTLRKKFTDNKVPLVEQKHLYVCSDVFNDLLSVDKYTRFDARGANEAISSGKVIKTYGFDIEESQIVQSSGSPATYHNMAYTKSGLVIASRPLPLPAQGMGVIAGSINRPDVGMSLRYLFHYDADYGCHVVTLDLLFGVAVLDDRRVVELESA